VRLEGLQHTGVVALLAQSLVRYAASEPIRMTWLASMPVAITCNVMNNLSVGLRVCSAVAIAHTTPGMSAGLLIGVDRGLHLSVSGSLATILWQRALRNEGIHSSAWQCLKLGFVV